MVGNQEDRGVSAAPTALSSASQIEPASGLAPVGLQSTDAVAELLRPTTEGERADRNWARADYLAGLLDQHGIAYDWDCASGALDDLKTHRRAWRQAIILARDFASEGSEDPQADRSYWHHELRAFDRTFDALIKSEPKP